MTRSFIWPALAIFLMSVLPAARVENSAYDLFQKALLKERSEGNLEEALKLYERIILEHKTERPLVARALLRTGACLEKLGKSKAREIYEQITRDFADQSKEAGEARAALARLASEPADARPGPVARQVWAGPDVDLLGAPSPDGRYLSFVDWSTGDLALKDLSTDKTRYLTRKGTWAESEEYAEMSIFSPDGKQVAYAWFNKQDFYELRVLGLDGSAPRTLYSNPEVAYLWPDGWSPDGKYILANFNRTDRSNQMALVSTADGSAKILKSMDWRWPLHMSFSPDGRYIAYDFPPEENSIQHDVFILAADGSRESAIVQHPANDLLVGWSRGGDQLLFASDRGGTLDLWSIDISGGKAGGAPKLIRQGLNRMIPLGLTSAGTFYYGIHSGAHDIYVASFNSKTGQIAAPEKVAQRFEGYNQLPALSPDGRFLAYLSRRAPTRQPAVIVIQALETGEERYLSPNFFSIQAMHWSADGLVVNGRDAKKRQGIFRIDPQMGEATTLRRDESEEIDPRLNAFLSRDGKKLYFHHKGTQITVRDLETGTERELLRTPRGEPVINIALSPDETQMALVSGLYQPESKGRSFQVMTVSTRGGEPVVVFEPAVHDPLARPSVEWLPEGDGLLVVVPATRTSKSQLWKVPLKSGSAEKLELPLDALRSVQVHPDGQRLFLSAGDQKAEVWKLENFLAQAR